LANVIECAAKTRSAFARYDQSSATERKKPGVLFYAICSRHDFYGKLKAEIHIIHSFSDNKTIIPYILPKINQSAENYSSYSVFSKKILNFEKMSL
jgi:hypothetical protein